MDCCRNHVELNQINKYSNKKDYMHFYPFGWAVTESYSSLTLTIIPHLEKCDNNASFVAAKCTWCVKCGKA